MKIAFIFLFLLPLHSFNQSLFTQLDPAKTGIHFQNTIRETATDNVLNYEYFYNGGGVAVGDLNNDHLPDIIFTSNAGDPAVYFNKGGFVFEDVSKNSKIRASGWKTGICMADVNGDGWLDVYICRSGKSAEAERRNLLFINQKNGSFREQAAAYGIDDKGYSTQAAFFDYDHDGDLDLYVLNHPIKRYTRFDVAYMKAARDSLAGDHLYRNDGGHFRDVSASSGISGNPISFGLGIAVADFNADGWDDIYVSNDYDEDDYLYINRKNGTFADSSSLYFRHTSKFSMGSDVGDVNNDGIADLITLDMLPEDNRRQKLLKGPDGYDYFQMLLRNGYSYQYMRNMLQLGVKNDQRISFSEIGQLSGVSNTDWSWSALFSDYDLDGWQDLFITNGYMRDYTNMDFLKYSAPEVIRKAREAGHEPDLMEVVKKMPASNVKAYLFRNKGDLTFENSTEKWGMGLSSLSNGAALGDFDNDGDFDLVVNNINREAFVWQNHAEDSKNHFLKIQFDGNESNRFGIGAKVVVSARDGFLQLQELQLSRGFQSSVEPCLIFGLGKRDVVDVSVTWPDGKKQTILNQSVNKTLTLEARNALVVNEKPSVTTRLFSDQTGAVPIFRHVEDDYNDFKREPLLPHQFSRNGPALVSGDVNGDGKADFYVGGAKGQAGAIFINQGGGKFSMLESPAFQQHASYEDVDAIFADLDGDKDLDLYVVSGGNEDNFNDRIYWNNGKGIFNFIEGTLPPTASSGGAVVAFDMDKDGDLDIFRGGQVNTGAYPTAPRSYLFLNDKGNFTDVTPAFMKNIGMVSSAAVADLNKDGQPDLVLAGEYMPVTILSGDQHSPYFSLDKQRSIAHSTGWWNRLMIDDIDKDGDPDIIAGNHGLNSQLRPTTEQPVTIDAADIDNNGSLDCVISYFIQGKSYPMPSRDELLDQVPSLKSKFTSYQAYSDATVKDLFSAGQFRDAVHLEAEEFRSGIFVNEGSSFSFKPFTNEVQAFPVRGIIADDFDGDGRKDLLMAGNNFAVRAQSGRYDAGKGILLIQQADGSFSPLHNSGFLADKDARKVIRIDKYIIVANNDDIIQIFSVN